MAFRHAVGGASAFGPGRYASKAQSWPAVGEESRPVLKEVCAALGFRIAFPHVVSIESIRAGEVPSFPPPDIRCHLDANPRSGRRILKLISEAIFERDVNPARAGMWKSWRGRRKYAGEEDRRELTRALWNLIGGSARRAILLTFASNGLFDPSVEVRRAAALICRDSEDTVARLIRQRVLEEEKDAVVREILRADGPSR